MRSIPPRSGGLRCGPFGPDNPILRAKHAVLAKLLRNDAPTSRLLKRNPFLEEWEPPRWVRAQLFEYGLARPEEAGGAYWTREFVREYHPRERSQSRPHRKIGGRCSGGGGLR